MKVFSSLLLLTSLAWSQTVDRPLQISGNVRPPVVKKQGELLAPPGHHVSEVKRKARVALVVDEAGHVAKVQLVESCGSEDFDKEVIKAARRYQFEPATQRGKPVAVVMFIGISFS